jgi:major intrinsic protein
MKISELCKMIEDSIHSGKYALEDNQRSLAGSVQLINRSSSDDLKSSDITIEVGLQDLYVLNNYLPNMQHLPGIIEVDILDSFKMLCRRLQRIDKSGKSTYAADVYDKTRYRWPMDKDWNSSMGSVCYICYKKWKYGCGLKAIIIHRHRHFITKNILCQCCGMQLRATIVEREFKEKTRANSKKKLITTNDWLISYSSFIMMILYVRSFGPALITGNFNFHWIYWAAPIIGGLIAAGVYKALHKDTDLPSAEDEQIKKS